MTVSEPQGLDYTPSPHLSYLEADTERWGKRLKLARAAMQDHTCTCLDCEPSFKPEGERQGPGHYGLRFFPDQDGVLAPPPEEALLDIFPNIKSAGVRVHGATEVIVGQQGTVWLNRGIRTFTDTEINMGTRHLCYSCAVSEFKAGRIGYGYTMVFKLADAEDASAEFFGGIREKRGAKEKKLREALGLSAEAETPKELQMISKTIRPCFARVSLPDVTIELLPNARELLDARWKYNTENVVALNVPKKRDD